jgi:hypothetical protein
MTDKTFSALVRQEFGYLVDDFEFSVEENLYGLEPFSDGTVEFSSGKVVVEVQLDRFDVMVSIGPASEPKVARVGLQTAVAYLTRGKIATIIDKAAALHDYQASINYQVTQYPSVLRHECTPLSQPSFNEWFSLIKFRLEGMQADYKRLTGKDLPIDERLTAYVRAKGG